MLASYVTISVMLIARFFSSGWLLATLKVLGTVIGVTVGFLLSLTLFTTSDLIPVKQFLLDWASSETAAAAPKRYPHEWIGEFMLIWTTEPTIGARLKWVLWALGGCLTSVGIATFVAQLIYQRGWENIRQLKVSKRKPTRSNSDPKASDLKGIAIALGRGKIRTMMLKDFLVFAQT